MNKLFQHRRFSTTKLLSLAGILFGASHAVHAEGELKVHAAEKVGMSSERLKRIDQFAQEYVDQGRYPGMVTMVARKGKVVHLNAVGNHGLVDSRPMQTDTLFRIYSMTKPVTAVAAMMLYEEGKLRLDDPVHYYLPELKGLKVLVDGEEVATESPMRVRQLFTHTAGFTYGFTPDNPVDIAYAENRC